MSNQWYFARDGHQQGPVGFAELQRLAQTGGLGAQDQVWSASLANWQSASLVPGLFPPPAVAGTSFPAGMPPLPQAGAGQVPLGYATPAASYAPAPSHDPNMTWLIPVGRSGWAIAAGYAGLLSLIPIFAPVAIILGLVALNDLKKNPGKGGKGRAIFGLVMGTLVLVLLAFMLFAPMARRL